MKGQLCGRVGPCRWEVVLTDSKEAILFFLLKKSIKIARLVLRSTDPCKYTAKWRMLQIVMANMLSIWPPLLAQTEAAWDNYWDSKKMASQTCIKTTVSTGYYWPVTNSPSGNHLRVWHLELHSALSYNMLGTIKSNVHLQISHETPPAKEIIKKKIE